jgi:diguanylate cyclase (GGDEF)-like protein
VSEAHLSSGSGWIDPAVSTLRDTTGEIATTGDLAGELDRLHQRLDATRRELDELGDISRRMSAITKTAIILLDAGTVLEANPAALRIFGCDTAKDIAGTPLLDLIHPDDRQRTAEWMDEIRPGDERCDITEVRFLRLSPPPTTPGTATTDATAAVGDPGLAAGPDPAGDDPVPVTAELLALGVEHRGRAVVQLLAYDVTERRNAEEAVTYQSLHDALTGLPNRLLFSDRVRQALNRTVRSRTRVAVLFCDIDRFQVVNDSLGHSTGDQLLGTTAERLRGALRPSDTVARFSGDEFVILCEVSRDPADVTVITRRILEAIAQPVTIDGQSFSLTASVGVAIALGRISDPDDLLRDAAAAMTQAKQAGRGSYRVFDEATRARAVGRMQIESALREAISSGQLRVHYQPIVRCSTGRIAGMEALVRWQHPEHGFVLPDSFIPVAEDSGLIVALGTWVLEQSCRQAAQWEPIIPEGQTLHLSVNLSGQQLADPGLVDKVRSLMLSEQGCRHKHVQVGFEVTETSLVGDDDRTLAILHQLQSLGMRIGIDDFGTGYSSLSYLRRFPVTSLKVDRSFVAGVDSEPHDYSIVSAVVNLAHDLGLLVIAEGVERVAQLEALSALGCDMAQGFLFGRPLSPEAMTSLLVAGDDTAGLPPAITAGAWARPE